MAAGYADYPLIAYHFQQAGIMSATLVPVFYAVAMAVSLLVAVIQALAGLWLGRALTPRPERG